MCTVPLPPRVYPIAVDKYIISIIVRVFAHVGCVPRYSLFRYFRDLHVEFDNRPRWNKKVNSSTLLRSSYWTSYPKCSSPQKLPFKIMKHSSSTIVRVIKSRRMRWPGHVARMGRGEACTGFFGRET